MDVHYAYTVAPSAVGDLRLIGSDRGLAAILWKDERTMPARFDAAQKAPNHHVLLEAQRQLGEYFAGKRKRFDLKLDFSGTDFQKSVWAELLNIPFGETRTYGDIAKRLGNEKATRAVGAANGRNPLPIVAPCHRVIGASGELTGFGGGLDVKARLLDLERGALALEFA